MDTGLDKFVAGIVIGIFGLALIVFTILAAIPLALTLTKLIEMWLAWVL